MIFDEIIDPSVDGTEIIHNYAFIVSMNGSKRRKETDRCWEILIKWKDGSIACDIMKDVNKLYLFQLSECSHQIRISQEPTFACWVPHMIKKSNLTI